MKLPKLICYDLDNTLVDTFPVLRKSLEHVFERDITDHEMKEVCGLSFINWFKERFGDAFDEKFKLFHDIYAKSAESLVKPFDGVNDFLEFFDSNGVVQIVTSNKDEFNVKREVRKFGFDRYLKNAIGIRNDGISTCKPSKDYFDIAVENYPELQDLGDEELWYFGDNFVDLEFARNIGAKVFFREDVPSGFEDLDITRFHEYRDLLSFIKDRLDN